MSIELEYNITDANIKHVDMKRNLILLASVPVAVLLADLTGGGVRESSPVPAGVTYARLTPFSRDNVGCSRVIFHQAVHGNALPGRNNLVVPGIKKIKMMEDSISEVDQAALNMLQNAGEEEFERIGNSRQKKPAGFLGEHDAKKDMYDRVPGRNDKPFQKYVDEDWGTGGWLSDAIIAEEKRIQGELDVRSAREYFENITRNRIDYTAPGAMSDDRSFQRFGSSGRSSDGKHEPFKPSFKIESWKPKNK